MSIYQRIVSEIVRKSGTESNTARDRSAFCFLLKKKEIYRNIKY